MSTYTFVLACICICVYVCLLYASQQRNSYTFFIYVDIQIKKVFLFRSFVCFVYLFRTSSPLLTTFITFLSFGSNAELPCAHTIYRKHTNTIVRSFTSFYRKRRERKAIYFFKITRSTLVRRHFTFGPQSSYNTHSRAHFSTHPHSLALTLTQKITKHSTC